MKLNEIVIISSRLIFSALLLNILQAQTLHANENRERSAIVLAANSTKSAGLFDKVRYNSSVIYSGTFKPNTIYYHNLRNPIWVVGLKIGADRVTCRPTLEGFKSTGTWIGQLKQDGTCDVNIEPVEWATGNWLNFSNAKGR